MVNLNNDQPLTGSEADQHLIGDHIALIYENPEERISAVTPLIRVGLEKGEICLYISNEEDDTDIVEALKAENIDVDKAIGNGGLILTHKKEMYFKRGYFDPDWTMKVIGNVADLAKSYGFTAMRIISDMTWTQEKVAGVEKWPEYEAKLNVFNPGMSLRIICQYDRRIFSPSSLIIALHAHPRVVSEGSINNNMFYVPTDRLLRDDYSELELERMLDSIRLHNSAESDIQNRDQAIEELRRRLSEENAARKSAEEDLDKQQIRFNDLAERSSDWSWELDENGVYTWSSARVKDMLGLLPEDVVGRSPMDLMTKESAEHISNILAKTMAARVPITALEKQAKHQDGRTVYLEMNGMPHFSRDGKFLGYRGIDRDITGRITAKQAIEESHKRVEESLAKVQERDSRIEALEVAISQLKALQAERDAATQSIKESLRSSQTELTKTLEELGGLRDALQAREDELTQARAAAEAKQAELEEQKASLTLIRQNLEDKDAELVTTQSALAEVRKALQGKEGELVALAASFKSQTLELGGVKESLSGVEEAMAQKAEELITLRQQVEKLNADLQKANESLASKEDELKNVMEQRLKAAEELDLRTKELTQTTEELEAKTTGLTEALAAAEALKSELSSKEEEARGLADELERKQDELDCASEENARIREELESKVSLVADLNAQLEASKVDLASLTEERQALQDAKGKLESDNAQLSWAKEQLDDLARVKDREIEELRSQVERETEELKLKEEQLASVLSESDGHKGKLGELLRQTAQLTSDQNVNETIIFGLREALAQRESWLAASRTEGESLASKARAAVAEKNALIQDLDRAQGQVFALTQELEQKGSDLTLERDLHHLSKEELELRMKELEEVRTEHQLVKEELDRTVQDLVREKEQHQMTAQERDEKLQALSAVTEELEAARSELAQVKELQQRTTEELEKKNSELESAIGELSSVKEELAQLTERQSATSEDLENKIRELTALNDEAEGLKAEVSQLREKNQRSANELEEKGAEFAATLATLNDVKAELSHVSEERSRTAEDLEQRNQELESLRSELETTRSDLEQLKEEHLATTEELDTTKSELSQLKEQNLATSTSLEQTAQELSAVRADLGAKELSLVEALSTIESLKGTLTSKVMELNDRIAELESRQQAALKANEELSRLHDELSARAADIEAERVASSKEVSRLKAIIDGMRTGVAVISSDGKILRSNPALRNLLGTMELEGHPANEVLPDLDLGRADFRTSVAEGVEFDVRASSVVDPEGGKGTVLTFSPRPVVPKPQPAVVEEAPEPPSTSTALDDPLTAILGSVSLAKEYVIPEGRMYGMLKQIENATNIARNKLMGVNDEPTSLVKGKGRVLILDDDESVLETTGDLLQYLGYKVEIARDEEEAIILCKQAMDIHEPFDMVIMDYVNVEGTPGQQVADRLREQIPHVRIIATGPRGGLPSAEELESQGFSARLLKPYLGDQLSRVMAEVMARK